MISAAVLIVAVSVAELPGQQRYGQAHQLERAGRHADSMRAFEEVFETESPLRYYAAVRASVNRALAGDATGGREGLRHWFDVLPEGPWKAMAGFEYGLLLQKSDMYDEAVQPLTVALEPDLNLWWQEDVRWAQHESLLRVADFVQEGRQYFRQAAVSATWSRDRIRAALVLAEWGDRESQYQAVDTLLQYNKYTEAAELIELLKEDASSDTDDAASLEWFEARAFIGLKRIESGRNALLRLADRQAGKSWEARALRSLAGDYISKGEFSNAERVLSRMDVGHPARDETLSGHMRAAGAYRKRNKIADAVRHLTYVHTAVPEHASAADSLLLQGEIHFEAGRSEAAEESWGLLLARFPKSPLRIETAFRMGELHGAKERKEDALESYRQASAWGVTDYYGYRAAQRLREYREPGSRSVRNLDVAPRTRLVRPMAEADPAPQPVLPTLQSDARFQRLQFFALHGLPEAEWESASLLDEARHMDNPLSVYMALGESGAAFSAMQSAKRENYGVLDDGTQTADRLRIRYPRAYWNYVSDLADEADLDPYLILSIARQESTFRPALISHAGATGVLQLMPDTAEWLVGLLPEIEHKHTHNLQDPTNSFRLGAYYFKYLLEKFDGNLVYALAAYNGGPGNVNKWLRSYGDLPLDQFIEKIPFTETRNYVKRILAHWATYHSLYPEAD